MEPKHIRKHTRTLAVISALGLVLGMTIATPSASALDLKDVLKVGGIAILVSQFGDQINKFIDSVLSQKGIARAGMTKVVPVVRIGGGTAVGAVQVTGPAEQVRKVQAVAELELPVTDSIRARALLPITTKKTSTSSVRSVGGVGVSANIKHPL